jgi:hypothetical protein
MGVVNTVVAVAAALAASVECFVPANQVRSVVGVMYGMTAS